MAASSSRQGDGQSMQHGQLLSTKSTFLDCRSPWTEPVELPRRPSSDPGASTDMTTTDGSTSQKSTSHNASHDRPHATSSRRVLSKAPDLDAVGGDTLATAAARVRRRTEDSGGPGPAGPSSATGASDAGAGPTQLAEAAGEEFTRISKTRRRRAQRRDAVKIKAQYMGADDAASSSMPSAESSSASTKQRHSAAAPSSEPRLGARGLSEAVASMAAESRAKPRIQNTKISL